MQHFIQHARNNTVNGLFYKITQLITQTFTYNKQNSSRGEAIQNLLTLRKNAMMQNIQLHAICFTLSIVKIPLYRENHAPIS